MKKTLKKRIRGLTQEQFEHLGKLCEASKNLYNQALYTVRQAYIATGEYLNYSTVDRIMKKTLNLEGEVNYRKLKAGVSQQTLRRLDRNFRSFFALKKTCPEMKPKPPKYRKGKLYNLIFDSQRFQIKDGKALLDRNISVSVPAMLEGKKIVQIEVIPRYNYYSVHFVFEDDTVAEQAEPSGKIMGIDLGLDNLAACATTDGQVMIVNGRPLKSINQFYNKKIAETKSELKKRNGRDWSEKAQRLTDKRNNKINDYQHKASRKIVNFCLENQISEVVIGNVPESANGINLGKRTNQNFVNMALGQFVNKLSYKLGSHGIKSVMTDESYTSKASFVDNDGIPAKYDPDTEHKFSGRRIHRGLYRSKDGTLLNADINGAFNIIRKAVPEFSFQKLKDGIEGLFNPHCRLLTC